MPRVRTITTSARTPVARAANLQLCELRDAWHPSSNECVLDQAAASDRRFHVEGPIMGLCPGVTTWFSSCTAAIWSARGGRSGCYGSRSGKGLPREGHLGARAPAEASPGLVLESEHPVSTGLDAMLEGVSRSLLALAADRSRPRPPAAPPRGRDARAFRRYIPAGPHGFRGCALCGYASVAIWGWRRGRC